MLKEEFEHIIQKITPRTLSSAELINLIDLTILNTDATQSDIYKLALKAQLYSTAAICVLPQHLYYVPADIKIPRATVINFPGGALTTDDVLREIDEIAARGNVNEIDYVFPYKSYLNGKQSEALKQSSAAYQCSKNHHFLFKVILETGAIESLDNIYRMSVDIITSGTDFIKTSTGKVEHGATLPAAFAMLKAIQDTRKDCGLKISGGIKTPEQALSYVNLAEHTMHHQVNKEWFRIGASALLNLLI